MARPIKNYCDYFPHDRDMRDHRKVKAVRNKFGITGYAVWSMILEYLTGIDGNEFENSDIEFELMSGDFGVSATEIREIVNYCIKLELLFEKNSFIHSESLDERLVPVYEKRKVNKSKSKKQLRNNGKFVTNNTVSDGITVTEKPQSKVKESKVDKSNQKEEIIENNNNLLLNEKLLIPQMFSIFKKYIPSYPGFVENDFEPLGKISKFLQAQLILPGNAHNHQKEIVSYWEKLCPVIADSNFYHTKSLSVISNQISEIYQIQKNGIKKNNGSLKSSGSELSGTAIIQPGRKANTAL